MAESDEGHHSHSYGDEEYDWENSKLYQCKLAYKRRFLAGMELDKEHRLLDVGCADGEFMAELSAKVHSIVGVDNDGAAIQSARQANTIPNVTYQVVDFGAHLREHGEEWREKFDLVISGFVLHFLDDYGKFIRNLHHCTKPGGRLHLTYFGDSHGWTAKAGEFIRNHPKWGEFVKDAKPGRNVVVESTLDDVKKLFADNGFTVVKIEEHELAEDDYSDEDAEGYNGVLTTLQSIPEKYSPECMADLCKFSRDNFGTNSPWQYVQLIATK
ncbi:polyketide synthase-nonribosomal peptide synthetase-like [Acanthaster planci]|uniref:Polyketide synthase-nonribosomal peptide synthetase-like n=1 Tax=Acanthaster planci TaxID=133434 RepID=A0A8B8A2I8_ACAPL|nr:polyketide synthase-nonribosomal peptide synthetase-like [Acanthaster planci]XP_022111898.1 polyketide synthase-nonribosomal peptide synthetase-like [Acanthaster planci]XP_022111899.1 polyketide synthase-nonribosomal peptide synthetase-like [Acanthaster planci]XP_022111900.1 polyketide synthase-nonribosomal peptide synthetase-like [Acanthaster planci]XP_022111901.1 polyketide synthase-nonribosomal peptide synthetase-like [Acanthaster planci]